MGDRPLPRGPVAVARLVLRGPAGARCPGGDCAVTAEAPLAAVIRGGFVESRHHGANPAIYGVA